MPFSIQELINKKVAEREERGTPKHWHASRLGACLCGVYLERKGAKPDTEFDERTLRVFSAGQMFEDWVTGLIVKEADVFTQQGEVFLKTQDLIGHFDLLVEQGGEQLIYEIKTIHSRGFWHMKREGRNGYDHHRQQLWAYLCGANIAEGRLLYISKDDLSVNEYIVRLDDEKLKDEVVGQLDELNRAWKDGIAPAPALDGWQAKRCRWHEQCMALHQMGQTMPLEALTVK